MERGIGQADDEENSGAGEQPAPKRREMWLQGQSTVILLANIMPKLALGPSMKVCSLSFCAVAVPSSALSAKSEERARDETTKRTAAGRRRDGSNQTGGA